tara:strand:- start:1192 stop:1662 length:471 start_codon:yes stop_codon:yes gene_type:complete
MINSIRIFNLVFIFSIFAIAFALFLEFFLGQEPCKLCIYQRIPYYLIILLGLFNYFSKKYFRYVYLIVVILIIFELLSSGYHTLVSYEIINFSGCESAQLPSDITQLKDALMNDKLIINCSNANLKYFGIPLSIYNFLFSSIFLIIIILNAYKKKN